MKGGICGAGGCTCGAGKEIDTLVIDADNIEEAKITAETLAHEDGAWWDDIEIKVSE